MAEDARQALAGLATRLTALQPAMTGIGAALEGLVRDRFETGRGPDGRPWPPSRRARAEGGATLVDSGRLRNSIAARPGADSVSVGTDVIYAAIHQTGGTIVPRQADKLVFTTFDGRTVAADRVDIPARPFLGMDEAAWDAVAEQLTGHLGGKAATAARPEVRP
ncbi:MAG: phage virion morphogenesis protein [Alphaproteobacteria bacterium]|jgi:phage virion morphogenesis protein|nr:phage virion morphogenesis protein [Alphaproteobacteria bacterium]